MSTNETTQDEGGGERAAARAGVIEECIHAVCDDCAKGRPLVSRPFGRMHDATDGGKPYWCSAAALHRLLAAAPLPVQKGERNEQRLRFLYEQGYIGSAGAAHPPSMLHRHTFEAQMEALDQLIADEEEARFAALTPEQHRFP